MTDPATDAATDHPVFQRARAAARLRPELRMARMPVPVTRLSNAPVVLLVRERGAAPVTKASAIAAVATPPAPNPIPPSEPTDTPPDAPPPQPATPPDVIELPPAETPQPITEPPLTTLAPAPRAGFIAPARQ